MRFPCTTLASLALLVAFTSAAPAQGDRVHLLSRFNARDGHGSGGWDYNDVFGYRKSDGREVALLGCWNGTSFVETTDPLNPVEIAFITHAGALWSDMAVYKDYVYVATDGSAGGGLQVIDVSDLSNIQQVGTYLGFNTMHSIFIDTGAAVAYCCGTDVGLDILDLSNPTAPTRITTYTNQYVHEATAQNGLAHFSEIYAGIYRTVDVSNLPTLTTLDTLTTPAAFTHSSSVDHLDALVGMTDEVQGAKFVLYDVSDPTNIVERSRFVENPAGILHNVLMTNDGLVHLSCYAEGYAALDITDPDRPIRIGGYDTWAGPSGNFNAAWGVFPQPSGTVYISNIEDGLFVLSRATRILHDGYGDTLDAVGPYVVTATILPSSAGGGVTGAELEYSTDDDVSTTTLTMTPTGNPDEWAASIPGQPRGTTVEYWIRATDGLGTSRAPVNRDARFVFGVGNRRSFYSEDFDGTTDGGWTHGAVAGTDDWQRGVPARKRTDPYRTTSGTKCFGNDLGIGGDGVYENGADNWLESPAVDLTNLHGVRLRFERWLRVQDAALDVARVLVNGVEVWRNPTNGGTKPTLDVEWGTIDLDVSAVADDVATTRVRFELKSGAAGNFAGWNVDDVELYAISTARDPEIYGTGGPGSGGYVPTLTAVGDPMIGGTPFALDGGDLLGGSSGLLLLGFARAQVPYKGLDILVDLTPPSFLIPVFASGPAGVPGAGTFSLTDSIPDDPAIVGIEVDTQILMVDAGAPKKVSSSAGLAFWICQ